VLSHLGVISPRWDNLHPPTITKKEMLSGVVEIIEDELKSETLNDCCRHVLGKVLLEIERKYKQ
jgi:hypothetical protein